MVFDLCEHQKTQIVINAAILRRKEIGLPEETNITNLYNEMAPLLGVPVIQVNSRTADHLPAPSEMKNEKGEFIIPNKPCPRCGARTFLNSICQSCDDAKDDLGNVVYKSGYSCDKKYGGCGLVDEKNGEWITQRLSRIGMEIPTGTKESLGIKTITDSGLK